MELEVLSVELHSYSEATNTTRVLCSGLGLRLVLTFMGAYELKSCCSAYEFELNQDDMVCSHCGRWVIGSTPLCLHKFSNEVEWIEDFLSSHGFDPFSTVFYAHALIADFRRLWASMVESSLLD